MPCMGLHHMIRSGRPSFCRTLHFQPRLRPPIPFVRSFAKPIIDPKRDSPLGWAAHTGSNTDTCHTLRPKPAVWDGIDRKSPLGIVFFLLLGGERSRALTTVSKSILRCRERRHEKSLTKSNSTCIASVAKKTCLTTLQTFVRMEWYDQQDVNVSVIRTIPQISTLPHFAA